MSIKPQTGLLCLLLLSPLAWAKATQAPLSFAEQVTDRTYNAAGQLIRKLSAPHLQQYKHKRGQANHPTMMMTQKKQPPAYIQADKVFLDQRAGTGTFTGHVTLDQGTTHIRADSAVTQQNKQHQFTTVTLYSTPKTHVHYETQPKPKAPVLIAEARTMIYDVQRKIVFLKGEAFVKQGKKQLKARELEYHLDTEQLIAKGQPNHPTKIYFSTEATG